MTLIGFFSLEDTSGDGELDLSGIDDLEIDRVSPDPLSPVVVGTYGG